MYFLSNLPHYEFIYEDDFVKMPPNVLQVWHVAVSYSDLC